MNAERENNAMNEHDISSAKKRRIGLRLVGGVAALSVSPMLVAGNGEVMPVHELSIFELKKLHQYTAITPPQFSTAAHVDVQSYTNNKDNDVSRQQAGVAAVYRGVSRLNSGVVSAPATTGAPTGTFNFKQTGDAAQAWATMHPNGLPFLRTSVFGKASASGNVSWTAELAVPSQSANHVYMAFELPSVSLAGANEQQAPSRWQARLRADLLLNGTVVWSSEAIRNNQLNDPAWVDGGCGDSSQTATYLNTFGRSLGLDPNTPNAPSKPKTIYLALGSYTAGETLELTLVVRADAQSSNHCCEEIPPNSDSNPVEQFCSSASAVVDWDNTDQPVRFWLTPSFGVRGG